MILLRFFFHPTVRSALNFCLCSKNGCWLFCCLLLPYRRQRRKFRFRRASIIKSLKMLLRSRLKDNESVQTAALFPSLSSSLSSMMMIPPTDDDEERGKYHVGKLSLVEVGASQEEKSSMGSSRWLKNDISWLAICFTGVMASFLTYGVLLEFATSGDRRIHERTYF